MDCDTSMSGLNTPIKKIRNLTLVSPKPPSPVRYPSMSDFPIPSDFSSTHYPTSNFTSNFAGNFSSNFNDYLHTEEIKSDPIFQNMVDKGYSQTISNKVLRELDSRANEISSRLGPTPLTAAITAQKKKKRYSGIHRPLFSKMESISSHYAASRSHPDSSPAKDFPSSATKKRRTLNGPEEIFGNKENESPIRKTSGRPGYARNSHQSSQTSHSSHSQIPFLSLKAPVLGTAPSLAPARSGAGNVLLSSPTRPETSPSRAEVSGLNLSSPSKFNKISPSKGSMNLNLLLHGDDEFVKPAPKIRQSSLQMAGVYLGDGPSLETKPSIPSLQKKSSIPSLQKKPSIPSLQKKSSIPSLQKKQSVPSLHKKQSIPSLHKKQSIPSLQKRPSNSTLQKKPMLPPSYTPGSTSLQTAATSLTPSVTTFAKPSHPSSQSLRTLQKKPSASTLNKVTVPQPFSLYDRPTISSSQKSLSSSTSQRSLSSLQSQASERSLNRFQKFKSRFS